MTYDSPIFFLAIGIISGIIAGIVLYHIWSILPFTQSTDSILSKIKANAINRSATDGFVIINNQGIILYANQAIMAIFQYEHEQELMGQNIALLMRSKEAEQHDKFLSKYARTGIRKFLGTDRKLKAQKKDGTITQISLSINEVFIGQVSYFAAFIRDISVDEANHKEIALQRNKFEALFNYSPDGMLFVDENNTIINVNEQLLVMTDESASRIIGHALDELYDSQSQHINHLKQRLESVGATWGKGEILARLNNRLGRQVTVSISSQAITSEQGQFSIYVYRDISSELELIASTIEKNQTLELSEALVNMGYWRYDVIKRELWCSAHIFTILNLPVSENNIIEIEDIYVMVHADFQQETIDAVQQCFAHHIPLSLSLKILLIHNEIKHIILKGINEIDNGQLTAIYGVVQDISDRLLQEERLLMIKERLERSQIFSNIGNWEWDTKTNKIYWSKLAGPMLGKQDKDVTTQFSLFIACIHPDDTASVNQAINRCIEQSEKFDIEFRVIWPDETIHWLHQQGDVNRDSNGTAISMIGVVQDITERKEKESQLMLFKQVIESSSQAIRVTTLDGTLIYANHAHQELFEHSKSFSSYHIADFFADDIENNALGDEIDQVLNRQENWSGESLLQKTDGNAFPAHLSISQFEDRHNKQIYRFTFCHDTSSEIAQREKLRQAKIAAESANRAKSEFLSSMSHELRTPLNAVLGFSQLLLRQKELPFTPRIVGNIEAIYKAGEHLLTLINGILELAKIESGKHEPHFEHVNIKEVIDEAVALIIPQAEQKGLSLRTAEGTKIPVLYPQNRIPIVDANFTMLKQAFINYLSNAVKYNKAEGIIYITVEIIEHRTTRITVCDNGIGIAAESMPDLFKPFNRLGLENSKVEGTGIGLTITKKNIENLKGTVGVKSKLGAGSSFWIELPYIDVIDIDNTFKPLTPSLIRRSVSHKGEIAVLYVEDNPSNTELMKHYFADIPNATLITAPDGETGNVMAHEFIPDIVMLDLNLPGIDGFQTLEIMKQIANLNKCLFIAVSADVMSETRDKIRTAGFDHYLSKPIDIDKLHSILDDYLTKV